MDDQNVPFPPPLNNRGRGGRRAAGTPRAPRLRLSALSAMPFIFLLVMLLGPVWVWFWWRVEPGNGEIAVLIKKTGKNLPVDRIIADSPEYKGIQLDVLPEGRFFRNPYTWDRQIIKATDVPAGKFGVLVRKFGKNLPGGKIIAPDEHHKGIVQDVLGTGKHRINPYAYDVHLFDDIKIAPGHVGVVTLLEGDDILSGASGLTGSAKGFLAAPGAKGVQVEILKEGTHRLNPFIYAVSIVNIQSQRFEFSGDDAIMFLTLDGFTMTVEGTLEFNLNVGKVALLTHEVGDMDDIRQKLILPSARGFFRIEGSKKNATDFIVGESRQAFQDSLETFLKKTCEPWGISLNSVLIRDILVPQEIAGIIRDRELAVQEARKFEQQIVQAKSQAELEKQKALADQNRLKVAAETERIRMKITAEQGKVEKTIAAKTELDVAKVALDSARADAEALLKLAEAERRVVEAGNKAAADVLKQQVAVYRDEADYVRAKLYEKVAPNIQSVLASDAGGGFLGLPVGYKDKHPAPPPVAAPAKKGGSEQ
ncbi:MAG: SPFH domain-containing protein [Kiritimatiellae bacterium]|nr:SPFH domain-containing protein [Kiritimatiellia bacterium]MDD3544022.1 SPFH domain-containing protein [Kiritimatiellia bacterium]MDD4024722.1 SPFH domain-containing protein [Kiritimatiellia bacterium]MDD4623563.1 SPFH domain-containing protein [Kiritimatiellia bacterium]